MEVSTTEAVKLSSSPLGIRTLSALMESEGLPAKRLRAMSAFYLAIHGGSGGDDGASLHLNRRVRVAVNCSPGRALAVEMCASV